MFSPVSRNLSWSNRKSSAAHGGGQVLADPRGRALPPALSWSLNWNPVNLEQPPSAASERAVHESRDARFRRRTHLLPHDFAALDHEQGRHATNLKLLSRRRALVDVDRRDLD